MTSRAEAKDLTATVLATAFSFCDKMGSMTFWRYVVNGFVRSQQTLFSKLPVHVVQFKSLCYIGTRQTKIIVYKWCKAFICFVSARPLLSNLATRAWLRTKGLLISWTFSEGHWLLRLVAEKEKENQGSVVRRAISANPGLNFTLCMFQMFLILQFESIFSDNFLHSL